MEQRIREIARRISEERGIPVEARGMGSAYYLYKDTTRWDKEKKKHVRVSEYIRKIDENGLIEKNRPSIYEFGNSMLLLSVIRDIVPELKHCLLDHWAEIVAISMIRIQDPKPIRYMKSAWKKLYAPYWIREKRYHTTFAL